MNDLLRGIANSGELPPAAARALEEDGFIVIRGPVEPHDVEQLAAAYDAAMAAADPSDTHRGRTGATTRVNDFVNRGPAFDRLYIYPPILEACCRAIGRPFKLSTMHARTLNPYAPAQGLHMDFPREAADQAASGWPMVGFIVMIDEFREDNGATRFVPRSHLWPDPPSELPVNDERQVAACGPAGSVIVYNGSAWHGHGSNLTGLPRRSIQGSYIRRDARSWGNLPARMQPETLARIGDLAKYLLDLDAQSPASDST